jgi:GntR family transcriptional regulator, carbon starvation induced regulator
MNARSDDMMPDDGLWRQQMALLEDSNSLCEQAIKFIKADIISGRLAPGSKLIVRDLTTLYGIGGTPLRDALAQLVGTGLVAREAQRGFRVTEISVSDLKDLGLARKMVELAALDLSLQNANDRWKERVREAHYAFLEANRGVGDNRPISQDWEDRHRAFHFALLSGCHSRTLFELCANLHDRFDRYRRIALPSRSTTGAVDLDHEHLVEAVMMEDSPRAGRLLAEHIDNIQALIAEFLALNGYVDGTYRI